MNELLNKVLQKNKTLCIHEIILNLIETLSVYVQVDINKQYGAKFSNTAPNCL